LGQPQQLQLVDSSGKLKNYWYLNGNFEKEYHDFIALPDYSSIIFEPTENCVTLYYHNPSVNERYNYSLNDYWIDNHFYRFKLCSNHSINLINSYGTIPENLHNTFVANFDKISFTGFKGKTLFSYSQNPNVEIFKNDKLIKSEQMTTGSFQPFNKSFDLNKDGNIDYMEDYLHSGDYCYRVFADSKNNYAIRITSIHQPRFLENGTMNRGVNPPWSISFLDSSLHYCGSVIFPKDSVDLTNVFMSNKNIIVIKSIKHENLFYKYQIVCNK
jgi:hypothetical protein